jgi:hypothetical protein
MKRDCCVLTLLLVCAFAATPGLAAGDAALMPELPGFSRHGEAKTFDADTLYEYVNGDAFTYLGFHFEELTVQEYTAGEEKSVTVDLFRHRDANNGFGIYSYERPGEGNFLEIGGEAYHEGRSLNFFKGPYYVKLSGAGLGERAGAVLTDLAKRIAAEIGGQGSLPAAATCFPESGLVPGTVRFVGSDFLGHGFLHSAFVAEYATDSGEFRAFIIDPSDPQDVRRMLNGYLEFLEKKGVEPVLERGVYRLRDPYHASEGLLHLKPAGNRLIGVLCDDPSVAGSYLGKIETNLSSLAVN